MQNGSSARYREVAPLMAVELNLNALQALCVLVRDAELSEKQ